MRGSLIAPCYPRLSLAGLAPRHDLHGAAARKRRRMTRPLIDQRFEPHYADHELDDCPPTGATTIRFSRLRFDRLRQEHVRIHRAENLFFPSTRGAFETERQREGRIERLAILCDLACFAPDARQRPPEIAARSTRDLRAPRDAKLRRPTWTTQGRILHLGIQARGREGRKARIRNPISKESLGHTRDFIAFEEPRANRPGSDQLSRSARTLRMARR